MEIERELGVEPIFHHECPTLGILIALNVSLGMLDRNWLNGLSARLRHLVPAVAQHLPTSCQTATKRQCLWGFAQLDSPLGIVWGHEFLFTRRIYDQRVIKRSYAPSSRSLRLLQLDCCWEKCLADSNRQIDTFSVQTRGSGRNRDDPRVIAVT